MDDDGFDEGVGEVEGPDGGVDAFDVSDEDVVRWEGGDILRRTLRDDVSNQWMAGL